MSLPIATGYHSVQRSPLQYPHFVLASRIVVVFAQAPVVRMNCNARIGRIVIGFVRVPAHWPRTIAAEALTAVTAKTPAAAPRCRDAGEDEFAH